VPRYFLAAQAQNSVATPLFAATTQNLIVAAQANYSVKWTAATCHGNLTLTVAAATYLKR